MPRKIWLLVLFALLDFAAPSFSRDDGARDIFLRTRKTVEETKKSSSTNTTVARKQRVRRPSTIDRDSKSDDTGLQQKGTSQGEERRRYESPKPVGDAIGLGYTLFLSNNEGELFRVSPTRIFETGQAVRLLLESNIDGYLYIFHQQDAGEAKMLYPTWVDKEGNNQIWAHEPVLIPAENEIVFVGSPATEMLTVVVSRKPIAVLPIGEQLKGRDRVTVPKELFRQMSQPCSCREAQEHGEGQSIKPPEGRREVELRKSDPVPAHILVARNRNESRLVARLTLTHR